MRYLLQRIGFYIFTAWAALTINFFIPRAIPGDPVKSLLARFQGQMNADSMKSLYVLFGIDPNMPSENGSARSYSKVQVFSVWTHVFLLTGAFAFLLH